VELSFVKNYLCLNKVSFFASVVSVICGGSTSVNGPFVVVIESSLAVQLGFTVLNKFLGLFLTSTRFHDSQFTLLLQNVSYKEKGSQLNLSGALTWELSTPTSIVKVRSAVWHVSLQGAPFDLSVNFTSPSTEATAPGKNPFLEESGG